jgi:thiamine-phosphate pyrophosphorylase
VPRQTLRIIDANCNRIGEGLRFLEDIARFILNDVDLSHQLKAMRHRLIDSLSKFGAEALSARDSARDVGQNIESIGQHQDLASLVTANARRAEEALRVIEELAKLPDMSPTLSAKQFEQARFGLYSLERELSAKLLRQAKVKRITGLYAIIDTQIVSLENVLDAAKKTIRGGAKVIQLRDKSANKGALLSTSQGLAELCRDSACLFIINDYLDIAIAIDADGLHIGQDDLPLTVIRDELPIDKIVGVSVRTLAEAQKAQAEGADYIAAGSIFPSPTKRDAEVVGLERIQQIQQAISAPVVAIGGINRENIGQVMAYGAAAAAVISAIFSESSIEQATQQLVRQLEKERHK